LLLGQAKVAQPRQYFEILNRMGVAGERHRKGTDLGAAQRFFRQQRRFGVKFLQPFDDRQRLGDDRAGIVLQCRNQPLRIEREVGGIALLALAQMVRQVVRAQTLQVQGYSDPIGRAAAEINRAASSEPPLILGVLLVSRH